MFAPKCSDCSTSDSDMKERAAEYFSAAELLTPVIASMRAEKVALTDTGSLSRASRKIRRLENLRRELRATGKYLENYYKRGGAVDCDPNRGKAACRKAAKGNISALAEESGCDQCEAAAEIEADVGAWLADLFD